jgi:uncharacterized RDD family membrane protein YckC
MKCPKCNYISFDGADRCRNCGYDLTLTGASGVGELPLRDVGAQVTPGADYPLAASPVPAESPPEPPSTPVAERPRRSSAHGTSGADATGDLPLFDEPVAGVDDTPLLRTPGVPRTPLGVRRSATTDTPRPRATPMSTERGPKPPPTARPHEAVMDASAAAPVATRAIPAGDTAGRRLLAAGIDAVLLGAIDAAVIDFTLRLTGLDLARIGALPLAPLLGFFAILNGGYYVGFTVASGQTIGKMISGVRVVADSTVRVPLATAVVRTAAMLATAATLGLGYVTAFTGTDRRALHDRLSGTRVVPG